MMIEFGVLGSLTVSRDGETVALRATVRRLLAVLLCRPGGCVTDEELIDALWGEDLPASPRKALQIRVYRLRQAIGEDRVVRRAGGYAVAVESGELDSARFVALTAEARALYQQGELDRASTLFAQALTLWRGDAFADVTGSELVASEARLLTEQLLLVREQRCGIELDLGRHAAVVAELTALANAHPHWEHAQELLMLALYRTGRRADALAAYRETRALFAEHLGVDPGLSLQGLHEAMLRADERLTTIAVGDLPNLARPRRSAARPEPVTGRPTPRQLPNDVAGFTGRGDALELLDTVPAGTEHGTAAIAVIEGSAGVGKTALAVHWAHRVANRFPDGQLYVNLRGYGPGAPMPPIEALAQFLRALAIPAEHVPTDVDEGAALYRSLLAGRSMLILLDNAGSADQVRPLLPAGSTCLVLVTSRERLRGLAALDGARLLTLDVLTPEDAVALLVRHRVAAEVPSAVAELAKLCAYLPLALRIAAANLAGHPGADVAAYTDELAHGNRLARLAVDDDQQVAVQAAFDLSYQAMPADAQRLFRLLGLVRSPDITPGAAAALANLTETQAARLLDRLARAHLLAEPAPGRYTCHDLLRLYARGRAGAEEPEADAAIIRLLGWYSSATDAAARLLYPRLLPGGSASQRPDLVPFADSDSALRWLDRERTNLVATVQHAAERGSEPAAWLLSDALGGYFWMRLHGIDWLATTRAGLAAARAAGDDRGQTAMLIGLGNAHLYLGQYQEAITCHRRAAELARHTEWLAGLASALGCLGIATWQAGRLPDAVGHLTEALAVNRQRTDARASHAANLGDLGSVHYEMGGLRQSVDFNVEALEIERAIGNRIGEAIKLANLAEARHALGASASALDNVTEAIRIIRDTGQRTIEPESLRILATVHRDAGRSAEALDAANSALAANEEAGYARGQTDGLNTLGTIYRHLGRFQDSVDHHERALAMSRDTRSRYPETEALIGLAETWRHLGDLDRARSNAEPAVALATKIGYRMLEGQAMTALAGIDLDGGRPDRAIQHAERALRTHLETGHRLGAVRARAVLDDAGVVTGRESR
jgi:DNA-binding SARP family transcriptional activator